MPILKGGTGVLGVFSETEEVVAYKAKVKENQSWWDEAVDLKFNINSNLQLPAVISVCSSIINPPNLS